MLGKLGRVVSLIGAGKFSDRFEVFLNDGVTVCTPSSCTVHRTTHVSRCHSYFAYVTPCHPRVTPCHSCYTMPLYTMPHMVHHANDVKLPYTMPLILHHTTYASYTMPFMRHATHAPCHSCDTMLFINTVLPCNGAPVLMLHLPTNFYIGSASHQ